MIWKCMAISLFLLENVFAVRLHKLFQFIDGFKSEHNLRGFLHVGNDYAVFLRVPKSHDKDLVYELYEIKHVGDINTNKPQLLAISKVPVEYIREQLKTFLHELYKAKFREGINPIIEEGGNQGTTR
ncbi:unnamed protein product, partial [Iphiclides podalirius]